jgi:hypothetical protein
MRTVSAMAQKGTFFEVTFGACIPHLPFQIFHVRGGHFGSGHVPF